MLKRALMITVTMMIGMPLMAAKKGASEAPTTKPAQVEYTICQMSAGDTGKLKFRGTSYDEAFQKVADACFQKRNTTYISSRNEQPDQDRQIQFIESCVNNIRCI